MEKRAKGCEAFPLQLLPRHKVKHQGLLLDGEVRTRRRKKPPVKKLAIKIKQRKLTKDVLARARIPASGLLSTSKVAIIRRACRALVGGRPGSGRSGVPSGVGLGRKNPGSAGPNTCIKGAAPANPPDPKPLNMERKIDPLTGRRKQYRPLKQASEEKIDFQTVLEGRYRPPDCSETGPRELVSFLFCFWFLF